ncbi:MAG: cyclic lactone autoinducer peptide [Coprobacillaceae bacterium]
MLRKFLNVFASVAFSSAKVAVATTSVWGLCQPEEPKL